MAAPGITVVKRFTYRGADEEYSNTYHFQGSAPSDAAGWRSLADAFITQEKALFPSSVKIVRVICYSNTDNHADYTYNLADFSGIVSGTNTVTGQMDAGDAAFFARWPTGRTNSKGKPIYLYKYWHPAKGQASDPDKLDGGIYDAVYAFANDVRSSSGAWPGLAGPDGVAPTGWHAELYITTRTLKRRGKRPT